MTQKSVVQTVSEVLAAAGYEQCCLPGYNAVFSVDSQRTFLIHLRNAGLLPVAGSRPDEVNDFYQFT
jgi:hypothetical protein